MVVLVGIIAGVVAGTMILVMLGILLHELLAAYRNPYPMFYNRGKRLSEIYQDKTKDYKTRSLLEDIKRAKAQTTAKVKQ